MTDYTEKNFKVLKDLEHIQHRPGMYIGNTNSPSHLLAECFDNSLDEAIAGYANIINIVVTKDSFKVQDNGRGIPLTKKDGVYIPHLICTKLFSGAKFDKGNYATTPAAGLHGVGLTAVNALSEWVNIEVYRDGKYGLFPFKNGAIEEEKISKYNDKLRGTSITFKPSKKYFDSLDLNKDNIEYLMNRIKVACYSIPKLKIFLNFYGEETQFNNVSDKDLLPVNGDEILPIQKFQYEDKEKHEKLMVMFSYSMDNVDVKTNGSVNLLPVHRGTHINSFYTILRDIIFDIGQKQKRSFLKSDCLIGLRSYCSILIHETAYSSQTKDELTTKKAQLGDLFEQLEKKITTSLNNKEVYENFTSKLLDRLDAYRNRLNQLKNENKISTNESETGKVRRGLTEAPNLKDCSIEDPSKTTLFIVEGQSAGGTLLSCRDSKKHAILMLKGKVINTHAHNDDRIFNNKEIRSILIALGTGYGSNCDVKKLRYKNVVIAADADPDGCHISLLLLGALIKYVPEIIINGNVFISEPPLFGAKSKTGKIFVPIYDSETLDKYRKDSGFHVIRYKGLGEMGPPELKISMLDETTRKWSKVVMPADRKTATDYISSLLIDGAFKKDVLREVGLYGESSDYL